jgi:hypothetical protein
VKQAKSSSLKGNLTVALPCLHRATADFEQIIDLTYLSKDLSIVLSLEYSGEGLETRKLV